MADNSTGARPFFRRALGLAAAFVLVTALAGAAGAEPSTEQKLDAAEAEFKQLTAQIERQQGVLQQLGQEAAVLAQ